MDDNNPVHFIEVPSLDHDEFCDICQEVRMDDLFYQEGAYIWDDYIYRPPDRSLKHILEHQQCPFCRLTLSAFHGSISLDCKDVEAVPIIRAIVEATGTLSLYKKSWNDRSKESKLGRSLCRLWFYDGSYDKDFNQTYYQYDWGPSESFQIQLLHGSTAGSGLEGWMETAKESYRHTRLVTKLIRPDLIKSWVQYCERHHQEVHGAGVEEPQGPAGVPIRLVDVENFQIVDANTGWRYLALSYVWGTSNFLTLSRANSAELYGMRGLSKVKIPRTIFDAMTLCAQLGERYLWIDSLCIQQDDEEDKTFQIQHMEMIYRNAVMTIANASKENNSADMPLPGVQPDSRAPFQQVHNIAGLKVVVSRRYPQPQAKQISTWATRAWTLQEEILSGRILYISDTHCWFQCPDCYFSEDVCLESAIDASKQSISTEHSFLTDIGKAVRPTKEQKPRTTWISIHSTFEVSKPTVPITLSEVFELIEAYTTRRATFRSDTLRAINGVLGRASSLDHGLTTTYHYGLPVTAFDYALCWLEDDHDPAKRRQGFPSWSWAGWVSPVKFPMGKPPFAAIGRSFSAMSLFTNALLSPEAKTFDLNISRQLINYFNKREDLENTEGDVEENRSFEELRNCYGICVSPKASIYTGHHLGQQNSLPRENKNQSLIFSTSYAKLRVDSTTRNVVSFDKAPSCRVYSLRSPSNSEVQLGIIRLNREWRESQPEVLELDFIVIRATPSEEFEPYWHNSKSPKPSSSPAPADWKIFLMCVAWIDGEVLEGKPRKAERITLAMVHEKRDCTRLHKYEDDDRENTYFLPSARDWMSVEPKPVEVLVELL